MLVETIQHKQDLIQLLTFRNRPSEIHTWKSDSTVNGEKSLSF